MLDLILGGAGCGKSCEMMNRIEAAASAGEDVLIIIPDQFSAEFDKSLYDRLGMTLFNRVNVLSFARTAKDIFIRHGGMKGRYADDTVKNIMMFRAVKGLSERGDLCFFDRQAKSVSFIESSLNIVKELMVNGITPEQFQESVIRLGDSIKDKASDISLIYSEYSRILKAHGYKDSEGDISEAAARAAKHGYFKGKTVFIDAFKSFTADELSMLSAMIADSERVTVCLTTADEDTAAGQKKYSVFDTVNRTVLKLKSVANDSSVKVTTVMLDTPHRFRSDALAYYIKNVFGYSRKPFDGDNDSVKVYCSGDCYGEGDFVCSEIKRLVMEEGYRYSDIAVLARQKEQYSSIMESSFERYGIPFYTDESYSAAHKSLFIFVKTALALAADERASSEDWLRYMKTGILGLSEEEIGAVEEYCYKWSVEGKMWLEEFSLDETSAAEDVRKRITAPISSFKKACDNADGITVCHALMTLFEETGLFGTLKNIYESPNTEDAAALAAVREIKQLWELLCGLLETLGRALYDAPVSLADFRDMFSAAVGRLKLSSPPQTLDSVRFVAAHTARLPEIKAVFVIGANDGAFPYTAKQEGIFNDRDRLALEEAGITLSGYSEDFLAEERFVAYSALSAPSEKLYMTYAMSDASGKALYPSSVVNRAEKIFGSDVVTDPEKRGLLSFCTSPEAAYYQYVQNYRRGDAASASLYRALDNIPEYRRRIEHLKRVAMSSGHSLLPGTGERLFGNDIVFSASRFEDYNKCPFIYYCKKGLEIYPLRKVDMDRSSKGTAIHYCLCEILKKFEKSRLVDMSREELRAEVEVHLEQYYKSDDVGGSYGKSKRYDAAFMRLNDTVTDILVRITEEFKQNKFVPDGFEYVLGTHNADEAPLRLTTTKGIQVYFNGMIDRVDVFEKDGTSYIRVVDYKSGTKEFKFSDLIYGVNMQMLLYLFALTDQDHNGKYKDSVPAGVLYMPSKDLASSLDRNGEANGTKDNYKMSGAVLDNSDVIAAMEENVSGEYIPVKLNKDGEAYSSSKASRLVKEDQFDRLRKYSYELLEETAGKLHDGRIEASPLKEGKSLPCEYCDYKTVCGNYPPRPSTVKQYSKDSAEQIDKIMDADREVEENEQ